MRVNISFSTKILHDKIHSYGKLVFVCGKYMVVLK
jgi:hypothetical protein